MSIHQPDHQKLKQLFDEVLLNFDAHKKWLESVDIDFITCMEQMIKLYGQEISKEECLRTGVMLGAVYEQWRQQQISKHE